MKTHVVQQETKVTSPSSITTSTAANLVDPDLQNLSVVASGLLNNQYQLTFLLISLLLFFFCLQVSFMILIFFRNCFPFLFGYFLWVRIFRNSVVLQYFLADFDFQILRDPVVITWLYVHMVLNLIVRFVPTWFFGIFSSSNFLLSLGFKAS